MVKSLTLLAALLTAARLAAQTPVPAAVKDLPLVELPADSAVPYLAVFLSGDGGWADIDRQVGGYLAAGGVPVVGWNTLRYFMRPHGPDDTARDLGRVLDFYLDRWKKRQFLLVGYSRGADMLPFLASRLPPARRKQVRLVAMLGPANTTRFQGLAAETLKIVAQAPLLDLGPEMEKLRGLRVVCFYGAEETDTLCHDMDPTLAECVLLPGAHHFGGQYGEIANRILSELKTAR